MILNWIVEVSLTILGGFIGLFPAWTLPGSIDGFGSALGSAAAGVNGVFPLAAVGICCGVILSAQLFILAWSGIVFVYELVPFKAT